MLDQVKSLHKELENVQVSIDTVLCAGDTLKVGPYELAGNIQDEPVHLIQANGCDSTVTINLVYIPV